MFWPTIIGILIVLAVADALGFLFWYSCSWPHSQVLGPVLNHGPSTKKQIALTFDDGPLPPYTEQVLDILKSRKIRATFFVCGKDVEQHPHIVHRIHSEGHAIGNHTWSHSYLYFMSRKKIAEEVDRTQEAIRRSTGLTPKLFRPPYGSRWLGLYPVLNQRGMNLVQWSLSAEDWKLGPDEIVRTVQSSLRPGAIILMHDGRQIPGGYLRRLRGNESELGNQGKRPEGSLGPEVGPSVSLKALPFIIDAAQAMGYEFVSLEDFTTSLKDTTEMALKSQNSRIPS